MTRFRAVLFILLFTAVPSFAYEFSTWIPTWDSAALASMRVNAGRLDEANPSWYTVAEDGSVARNWNAEDSELRAALAGVRLVPTIKNYINGKFDAPLMSAILASSELREQHAEAITRLVVEQALDGIDLDYEAMPATDRDNFTAFVQLLAGKLHEIDRTLSVTVHAKTSSSSNWKGPGSQDWPRLGAAADSIKIMAYDYHWATSEAGPVAPLDWIESVAAYAVSTIPAKKVRIALPWYGYDWSTSGGKGVTWKEAVALAQSKGAVVGRDVNGEATFTYGSNVVFYQDRESYRRKVDRIVTRYPGIGGFAHWRAGGEDPEVWDVIRELQGTGGAGGSEPEKSFTLSAPSSLAVRAGETATAAISIAGINGFDSTVSARIESVEGPANLAELSGATLVVGRSLTLTAAPARALAAGAYRIRLVLEAETNRIEHLVRIEVSRAAPLGSFSISGPSRIEINAGDSTAGKWRINGADGFESVVAAKMELLDPFRGTASFTSSSASAADTIDLAIKADKKAADGVYRLRLVFEAETNRVEQIVEIVILPTPRGRKASR